MIRIAHIVVPVAAKPPSDLVVAQPITFESMRRAARQAKGAEVELWITGFEDERAAWPDGFREAAPLTRASRDLHAFRIPRRLPVLRDILERLAAATDAEYLVYTNADIALQPHFYTRAAELIAQGHDAFTINRRTITDRWSSPADLEKMYAEEGGPHPGYDCFVFRRDALPRYVLGDVFLGTGHVDLPLICSMITFSDWFLEITGEKLTFHLGDARSWWKWKYRDAQWWNDRQAAMALRTLMREQGVDPGIVQRLLLCIPLLKNRLLVDAWMRGRARLTRP